jgi:hypothetical protein
MLSTAISHVGYDPATRRLFVTFLGSGKTYVYADVPESEYADFQAAASKGWYFNARIRDRYLYEEMNEPPRARSTIGRAYDRPWRYSRYSRR